ncbi:Na/Pi symporter [Luteimonas fraxinea]|uniref:Na/Pi symporter n=1 Tax=Luteimonas fraxinea TaxID=2901869 RepID=A0ABS8U9F4_9GAMM|nr:Na/Pi symporter [Luteimonas fraxinea]MCD9095389.1 Na/Pi symporter [Luteimonas fraxinea]MCD9126372.1 Na/Pi symporter [Luteimonas fraxinea]UHH11401.1 Na/Pi symporter [Luteimonas fraxinea]
MAWSFWRDAGWLQLCAGLAIFLFGMQCLEDGLRQLAGSRLEQVLGRSTRTRMRGLLFGIGGTVLLQSSTLVSLLTIAFLGAGLIQLAGGIAIILGANLCATSGIWLLALAGQDVSLSPLALPLLVFGVLAGFTGARGKAAGQVVLGVAFIFLGIDQLKVGFGAFGGEFDLSGIGADGIAGTLLFAGAGALATVVLQSSHATLMLTLAALASGQLALGQALAIAIGANVGSSVSTAFVGVLGGSRSGQRLALAHVLFNGVTAILALALLAPLAWLVRTLAGWGGFGDNTLLQLALFHTLFNASGAALFWPCQQALAAALERWLPDRAEPEVLITELAGATVIARTRARHLDAAALESADTALMAVAAELRHLGPPEPGGDLPRAVPASRPADLRPAQRGPPGSAPRRARAGCRGGVPAARQGGLRRIADVHGATGRAAGRGPPAGVDPLAAGRPATGQCGQGRAPAAGQPERATGVRGRGPPRRLPRAAPTSAHPTARAACPGARAT